MTAKSGSEEEQKIGKDTFLSALPLFFTSALPAPPGARAYEVRTCPLP